MIEIYISVFVYLIHVGFTKGKQAHANHGEFYIIY